MVSRQVLSGGVGLWYTGPSGVVCDHKEQLKSNHGWFKRVPDTATRSPHALPVYTAAHEFTASKTSHRTGNAIAELYQSITPKPNNA